jgi:SAM-dependent methyltransferase
MTIVSRLKEPLRRALAPPSTNYRWREIKPNPYELLAQDPLIFDIGSKGARGYYGFGPPPPGARVVCVDLVAGPGVDLVADAHNMHMVPSNSVNCVVSISTIEHVRYPHDVIAEIYRILKPGGIVYLNIPFIFAFHADPDDYYRFSFNGIKILCEKFEIVDSGFNRGPASTMADLLARFCSILFSFNNERVFRINRTVFRWLLFWIKYFDCFIAHYKMANMIAGDSYLIGRKPELPSHISSVAPSSCGTG